MQVEAERIDKVRKAALLHLAMEVDEAIRRAEEDLADHPDSMQHFFDLLKKGISPGEDATRKAYIGVMCNMAPEELIRAAGAVPVRLCSGSQALEQIGSDHLPAGCCSLVKATVGRLTILRDTPGIELDMVVIPTTCDQRRKAAEMLRNMGFNVFPLEAPPVKESEEAVFYWHNSIKNLVLALEKVTGKRITRRRLRDSIAAANEARRQYRRLYDHMRLSPSVIFGTDAMIAIHTRFFEDPARWADAAASLGDELDARVARSFSAGWSRGPRILLTGSPPIFPNIKLPLLIETLGAVIVSDEVCSSSRLLYDAVSYDEESLYDMIPAVADRYLKPCTCPFLVGNSDRVRRLLAQAAASKVDGVIYQSFSGCSLYEMEQGDVAKALRDRGIPMLYVQTDYSPEDMGQLSTRIEAFLESIQNRKRS